MKIEFEQTKKADRLFCNFHFCSGRSKLGRCLWRSLQRFGEFRGSCTSWIHPAARFWNCYFTSELLCRPISWSGWPRMMSVLMLWPRSKWVFSHDCEHTAQYMYWIVSDRSRAMATLARSAPSAAAGKRPASKQRVGKKNTGSPVTSKSTRLVTPGDSYEGVNVDTLLEKLQQHLECELSPGDPVSGAQLVPIKLVKDLERALTILLTEVLADNRRYGTISDFALEESNSIHSGENYCTDLLHPNVDDHCGCQSQPAAQFELKFSNCMAQFENFQIDWPINFQIMQALQYFQTEWTILLLLFENWSGPFGNFR